MAKDKSLNMSWQDVIEAYRKEYNKNNVACQVDEEREFIIKTILNIFPTYSTNTVTSAVMHCCRMISEPRPRDLFFEMTERIITNHLNINNKTNEK